MHGVRGRLLFCIECHELHGLRRGEHLHDDSDCRMPRRIVVGGVGDWVHELREWPVLYRKLNCVDGVYNMCGW